MMATPTVTVPANELAASYDIHDPVHEYAIPDPKPPVAAAPAAQANGQTPTAQPVAVVTPVAAPQNQPAPSAPAAPVQRHPDWLLREVTALGLHPVLLERLDTPDLTQLVLSENAKLRDEFARNKTAAAASGVTGSTGQPGQMPLPSNPQSPQNQPNAPAASATQPAWDWGIHDDVDDFGRPVRRQITDADIHPALAHHIKTQAQRIAALEGQLSAIQQQAVASTQSQVDRQFDAAFNKLGGVFGTGTAVSLQGKPELEKRVLVYNAVKAMFSSLPPQAREQMGIEKAVITFAKSMFGVEGPAAAVTPQSVQPTAEQFRNGAVGTPTQRHANDKALGREKAIEEAQNWWKENQASGAIPQGGGTSMDEFFPIG